MALPNLKLISFSLCPYVQRSLIVLLEKNVPHEIEYIDLTSPPEWFYDISPLEKVPVLLVDGEPLFESMAICEFLDEITANSLHPSDPFKKAQNRAWIEFGNDILNTTYNLFTTTDEKNYKQSIAILTDRFDTLEEYLEDGPYFNGDDFAIIDAVYGPIFRYYDAIHRYLDHNFFEDCDKLIGWSEALLSRPSVIKCVPQSYHQELEQYFINTGSLFSEHVKQHQSK